jgi:lysylphosphatidylglycerol synthetase-like protein (DUF2156 family)
MAEPHPPSSVGLYLTWASLVALTLSGALLSRGGSGHGAAFGLLTLAALKVALIGLVFMGLRRAHAAWSLAVGAGVLAVLVASAWAISQVG